MVYLENRENRKLRKQMKLRLFLASVMTLLLASSILAQELSREDFRDNEWRMKAQYYQKLLERQSGGMLLDQTDFDVKYWDLHVNVTNIQGQIITGFVTMTSESVVDGLASIDYDFHSNMTVDSVRMYGSPAPFTRPSNIVHVTLDRTYNTGEQFTTLIYYHGHPPGGGFGSFGWDTHNGQPIVSTLSEPEGAREWWPCKDMPHDKADSADVHITIPDNLVGTSNGVLVSEIDNGNGTKTYSWHISYPITTYLISLAISNYQSFTDWYVNTDGDSMPVTNYVYPEHYSQAVEDLSITPDAIGIFAGLFGEYPFIREKYGMSIFPWGGAMEHQCNTSYGSSLIRGNHTYDWILVHELAHMWFGDMITCDTWPDIWMNEGFASYLEALWIEDDQGFNGYLNYMRYSQPVSDPSGPIYDPNPLFDGNTVYNKGAWVLHMLRGVMGDDAFFQGMYAYANHPDHQYGTIQTRQFQHIMEDYYGSDLDWFFDQWVWGMNRPTYRYSWLHEENSNGRHEVFLHIRQTQNSPSPNVFTMPIQVFARINGVDTVVTVWNDRRTDDLRFVVNDQPTMVRLDVNDWFLKNSSLESYTMNIVTRDLPDGDLQHQYNQIVEARGGTTPYAFTIVNGSLPDNLELDSAAGEISGQPIELGEFSFTIRCTDSSSPAKTDDNDYTINIYEMTGTDDQVTPPSNFALLGNYPNPFNNSTVIRLNLANPGNVSLEIFNLLGQHVELLHDGYLDAGLHEIIWNGDNIPSGVYFYKLTAGEKSAVKKMALIK